MNASPKIPSLEVRNRLIENSRRARLGLVEVGLIQDELIAKLDELLEQQRLQRIEKRKQKEIENHSVN